MSKTERGGRIAVVRTNPFVTLQDGGRRGAMRYGVSQSGPMDWVRFGLATTLAGAPPAAFEVGIAGASFSATGEIALAVAGPGFSVRIGGTTVAAPVRLTLADGATMEVLPGGHGMWAYVAVAGLDPGAPVLGSYATNARTGMGSRDLSAGFACALAEASDPELFADPYDDDGPVGLRPGPQSHMFSEDVRATLAGEAYRLTDAVDRMGYRIDGPRLKASSHDIVSDGIVEGAIQVPGDGKPIILMADRAPTGGYPKIAVLAAADRPRLAQRRPGDTVRFAWLSDADATARRRSLQDAIAKPQPRARVSFDTEFLASRNLVGGVWPGPGMD